MSATDTGGPAFPYIVSEVPGAFAPEIQPGMTLRDYFAAKAMAAMVHRRERAGDEFGYESPPDLATRAYAIADAMLEARKP